MRIVFLGSPPFATSCFRELCESAHRPLLLVTQPQRRQGRGRRETRNPLVVVAEEFGVSHRSTEDVSSEEFLKEIAPLQPEWAVIVSFGQILKRSFLGFPEHGCLNVHASLLPRHRGAAPIAAAIRAGDAETGISIQRIVPRLDAGDVLLSRHLTIGARETAGELLERLAALAGPVLVESLDLLERGEGEFVPQDEAQATRAPKMSKADGRIDWSAAAIDVDRHIRSVSPWPGAQTELPVRGKAQPCKVVRGEVVEGEAPAGVVVEAGADGIVMATGAGAYRIHRLQPSGGKPLTAEEFLRGRPVDVGRRAEG